MILNLFEGKELPVYGDGLNVRDWLYVEDHAEALWTILTRGERGHTYNVGGNNEWTNIAIIKRLIQIVAALTGQTASGAGAANSLREGPPRPRPPLRHRFQQTAERARLATPPRPGGWPRRNREMVRGQLGLGSRRALRNVPRVVGYQLRSSLGRGVSAPFGDAHHESGRQRTNASRNFAFDDEVRKVAEKLGVWRQLLDVSEVEELDVVLALNPLRREAEERDEPKQPRITIRRREQQSTARLRDTTQIVQRKLRIVQVLDDLGTPHQVEAVVVEW
jgi:hypothetical protein